MRCLHQSERTVSGGYLSRKAPLLVRSSCCSRPKQVCKLRDFLGLTVRAFKSINKAAFRRQITQLSVTSSGYVKPTSCTSACSMWLALVLAKLPYKQTLLRKLMISMDSLIVMSMRLRRRWFSQGSLLPLLPTRLKIQAGFRRWQCPREQRQASSLCLLSVLQGTAYSRSEYLTRLRTNGHGLNKLMQQLSTTEL